MAIPAIDMAGAAAQAAPQGAANGAGFDNALQAAQGAGGGNANMMDQMVQTGVQVMGGIMMRLAGDILNEGMSGDDEE